MGLQNKKLYHLYGNVQVVQGVISGILIILDLAVSVLILSGCLSVLLYRRIRSVLRQICFSSIISSFVLYVIQADKDDRKIEEHKK